MAERVSFVEMVVPYGDPGEPHCRKNAFDAGEDGVNLGGCNSSSPSPLSFLPYLPLLSPE